MEHTIPLQALTHKPCDKEYELYPALFMNLLALLWWIAAANTIALAIMIQNKLKPVQALGLEERS